MQHLAPSFPESRPRPTPTGPQWHPDPVEPGFIRWCEDPTREQICTNTMATALRGMVEAGQISEAQADRELWLYRVSLEQDPFSEGFQPKLLRRLRARTGIKP
jgi:hypothetical protein